MRALVRKLDKDDNCGILLPPQSSTLKGIRSGVVEEIEIPLPSIVERSDAVLNFFSYFLVSCQDINEGEIIRLSGESIGVAVTKIEKGLPLVGAQLVPKCNSWREVWDKVVPKIELLGNIYPFEGSLHISEGSYHCILRGINLSLPIDVSKTYKYTGIRLTPDYEGKVFFIGNVAEVLPPSKEYERHLADIVKAFLFTRR